MCPEMLQASIPAKSSRRNSGLDHSLALERKDFVGLIQKNGIGFSASRMYAFVLDAPLFRGFS